MALGAPSGAGAREIVAAILDWEFAFAGSFYCDIGNFLRYERAARPVFEPFFSRGCRDAGVDLHDDWFMAARIADLPALCELLARDSTPDDVVRDVLGLVTATLDQQTADALIGNTGVGAGSSMPPKGAGAGSVTNSGGTSDFGSRTEHQ